LPIEAERRGREQREPPTERWTYVEKPQIAPESLVGPASVSVGGLRRIGLALGRRRASARSDPDTDSHADADPDASAAGTDERALSPDQCAEDCESDAWTCRRRGFRRLQAHDVVVASSEETRLHLGWRLWERSGQLRPTQYGRELHRGQWKSL